MALTCKLANDLLRENSCGYVLQSVQTIYLANTADVTAFDIETGAVTLSGETKWYKIEPAKNTASFTDVLNVTDSGNKYRTHTLSFSVAGVYSTELKDALDNLSLGSYLAIAVFASGEGVLLGTKNAGLEATVVTNTGAASATEASGISVEMSADLTNSAFPIADVDAVINPGA